MSEAPEGQPRPANISMPARALLYARTLRHLQFRQVRNQLRRRLLPRRTARPPAGPVTWRHGVRPLTAFLDPPVPEVAAGQITFVGLAAPFAVAQPDWQAAAMPRLWRYNLHYFDFLHGARFTRAQQARLVDDWIARVPPGPGAAWEPYPLSLRVVNWLKFVTTAGIDPVPERWVASLALQLEGLSHDLEYHLLANHLFKNAKALVFGGLFLDGVAAQGWLRQGLAVLLAEAREQFLPDGGHIERSPMYHALMLEDLLDVLNAAAAVAGRVTAAERAELAGIAARASRFLAGMRGGDGEIPLFNDAALGITRPAGDVLDYAASVLGEDAVRGAAAGAGDLVRVCWPDTGYFGYRQGGDSLIVDCGAVGPDYQPGHAHCDALSYELCLDGARIIVDSGVFDYEISDFRRHLRSTAAHNTVVVDGEEQSEIWGAFRVARRARPTRAELAGQPGGLRFTGAHDGYARLPGRVLHEREITLQPPRAWRITDRLTGAGAHRAESHIHLRPGLEARLEAGTGAVAVTQAGRPVLSITPTGPVTVRLGTGWYCPEFGRRLANAVVTLEWQGALPAEFGYVLTRQP